MLFLPISEYYMAAMKASFPKSTWNSATTTDILHPVTKTSVLVVSPEVAETLFHKSEMDNDQ